MSEPVPDYDIFSPSFWRERIEEAPPDEPHWAIYKTTSDDWQDIGQRHREIIERTVSPHESVLDAGCGWGRLLSLMPEGWWGDYAGVDLSPEFVRQAKLANPRRAHSFYVGDLRQSLSWILPPGSFPGERMDWAVLVSVRAMVLKYKTQSEWDLIESQIRKVAKKILYLEYSSDDRGSVE